MSGRKSVDHRPQPRCGRFRSCQTRDGLSKPREYLVQAYANFTETPCSKRSLTTQAPMYPVPPVTRTTLDLSNEREGMLNQRQRDTEHRAYASQPFLYEDTADNHHISDFKHYRWGITKPVEERFATGRGPGALNSDTFTAPRYIGRPRVATIQENEPTPTQSGTEVFRLNNCQHNDRSCHSLKSQQS